MSTATLTKADVFKAMEFTPYKLQQEISDQTGTRFATTSEWGRGSGKTTIACAEVAAAMILRPGIVCHGSGFNPVVRDIMHRQIVDFLKCAQKNGLVKKIRVSRHAQEFTIQLDNGSTYRTGRWLDYDFMVKDDGDVVCISDRPGRIREQP